MLHRFMLSFAIMIAFSTTASFAADFVSCDNITASGTHTISANITGANQTGVGFSSANRFCMKIATDNVSLDCQGNTIIGNGTSGGITTIYGILVQGEPSPTFLRNVTVRNCRVKDFNGSFYAYRTNDSVFANNTFFNITDPITDAMFVGSGTNNHFNNLIENNTVFDGKSDGINIGSGTNATIRNNVVYNITSSAIIASSSTSFKISNNSISASNNGIDTFLLNNTIIANNTAYNNSYGFEIGFANSNNTVVNNTAHSNRLYGFEILNTENSTFSNNSAYNGSTGFRIYTSANNTFVSNLAFNNTNYGFSLGYLSFFTLFANNSAYRNLLYGFFLDSFNTTMVNNTAHSNTEVGVYINGFTAGSANNTLINNSAYNNSQHGFYLTRSQNGTFINNSAFNNSLSGFLLDSSSDNNSFINNIVYNNSQYGMRIETSNMTNISGGRFFRNNIDFSISFSSGSSRVLNLSGVIFDNPTGNLSNYTNISLGDTFAASSGYQINWTARPAALPTGAVSFMQKFVNISAVSGTVNIENITWRWDNSEIASFDETKLKLYKYNASGWTVMNSTPDTASNVLGLTAFIPSSTFAIFQDNGVSACAVINSSGTYTMTGNAAGAPNAASPFGGNACIKIVSSNVLFDCAGYNVTNNGTTGTTYGVLVNGSTSNEYSNITIRNCRPVANYTYGIHLNNTNNSFILNNMVLASVLSGKAISINASSSNLIENNTVENNSFYGFYFSSSNNNTVANNTALNNSGQGFYVSASQYNSFSNNLVINSSFSQGFLMVSSHFNSISNVTVAYSKLAAGFDLSSSDNNSITGSTSYGNGNSGFFLEGASNNNSLYNNTAYNNTVGFFLEGSHNNSIANSTAFNNAVGFNISTSNINRLTNNSAYGNSLHGFMVSSSTMNNITNGISFNNRQSGFHFELNASNNSMLNVISFNNSVGINMTSSNFTNITNATLYNSSYIGMNMVNSNNTRITGARLFSNGLDFLANSTFASFAPIINISSIVFDNPTGGISNYTNVSVSDIMEASTSYSFNWSSRPSALPSSSYISFRETFINITNTSGAVSLDNITLHWAEGALTNYNETRFELWKYNNSGWVRVSNNTNTVSNTLSVNSINVFSVFGILQNNDTTVPVVTLNSPANASLFNFTSLLFNFTATDDSSSTVNCSLFVDGALNQTNASVLNNTATAFNITLVAEGRHYWNVQCLDNSSNAGTSETRNFTVDATRPGITLNAPANASVFNASALNFSFTPLDLLSATLNCSLFIDGALNQTNSSALNNTATNFSVSSIAQGGHYWNVQCRDTANNTNTSETRNFTIDTTLPGITLNSPANASGSNTSSVTFNFTAVDNIASSINCSLFVDGALNQTNATVSNNTATVFSISTAASGSHYWSMRCTDTANNTNVSETRNFTIDSSPPAIYLMSPQDNFITVDSNATFTFNATDNLNATFACSLLIDGSSSQSNLSVVNNTATNFTASSLANGLHTWAVTCADNVNTNATTTRNFTINAPSPSPPPSSGGGQPPKPTQTFNISATLAGNAVNVITDSGVTVNLIQYDPYFGIISSGVTGSNGSLSFVLPRFATYSIEASKSGYISPSPIYITYATNGTGELNVVWQIKYPNILEVTTQSGATARVGQLSPYQQFTGSALTDAQGKAQISLPMFGTYQLNVTKAGYADYLSGPIAFDSSFWPGAPVYRLSIYAPGILGEPVIINATLDDDAIQNATIYSYIPNGTIVTLSTNSTGGTLFTPLIEGTYRLSLIDQGTAVYTTEFTVSQPSTPPPSSGQACGNNIAEGSEACDGSDLRSQTCSSQGFEGGGVLGCSIDCTSFNTSQCAPIPANDCEISGEGGNVGDDINLTAQSGGEPCPNIIGTVRSPDGSEKRIIFNGRGEASLHLGQEGEYALVLGSEDRPVRIKAVKSQDKGPLTVASIFEDPVRAASTAVVVVGIGIALYLYLRARAAK